MDRSRSDISRVARRRPAGTAVRFAPGAGKTVNLVPIAGARVVRGGNAWASGPVDETRELEMPE